MNISRFIQVLLIVLFCHSSVGFAAAHEAAANEAAENEAAFVSWARDNAVPIETTAPGSGFADLQALKDIIGDARVVGFGETAHGIHEFNELKVRIFEFLAEEMGFTAFVMESGLAESKLTYDYVLGADYELAQVYRDGFSHGFGPWEETRALLEFMRAYNANPAHSRKIHFYGMDLGKKVFPGEQLGIRSALPAVAGALSFLDIVDPHYAESCRQSLVPKLEQFKTEEDYQALSATERAATTAATAALVARLAAYRIPYIEASSVQQYEWAYRLGIAARQLDTWFAFLATDVPRLERGNAREMTQADNVRWVLEREGPDARIMVWAHNGHVVKEFSASEKFWTVQDGPYRDLPGKLTLLGLFLESLYGDDYINFGFTANRYDFSGERVVHPMLDGLTTEPAVDNSYAAALRQVGAPLFALDLNAAPDAGPVREWLQEEHPMRYQHMYMNLVPERVWDAVIYFDTVRQGHWIKQ